MSIPKRSTKAERNARPPSPKAYRTRPLVTFSLSLQDKHQLIAIAEAWGFSKSATIGRMIRAAYAALTEHNDSTNAKIAETFKPKGSAASRTRPLPFRRVGAK